MTTKYLDGVQVTEGRGDSAPRLIATYNYNEFTASATKWKTLMGILNRNARARTYIFQSTLNQPLSGAISLQSVESTVGTVTSVSTPSDSLSGTLAANGQLILNSEKYPTLVSHSDSVNIGLPMGATLPTSGVINVYVVEVF